MNHVFLTRCANRDVNPAVIIALMSQGMDFDKACSLYNPNLSLYFTYGGVTLHLNRLCRVLEIHPKSAMMFFNADGMSLHELVYFCGLGDKRKWKERIDSLSDTLMKYPPRFVMDDGNEYSIPALSKKYGISKDRIQNELASGKTIREVLRDCVSVENPQPSTYSLYYQCEIDGVRKSLCQWLAHYGIIHATYRARRKKGMTVEDALKTPVRKQRSASNSNDL